MYKNNFNFEYYNNSFWNGSLIDKGGSMLGTILLIILILLLVGAFPAWPYSAGWGYYPSGILGLVFIILLILVLLGRV